MTPDACEHNRPSPNSKQWHGTRMPSTISHKGLPMVIGSGLFVSFILGSWSGFSPQDAPGLDSLAQSLAWFLSKAILALVCVVAVAAAKHREFRILKGIACVLAACLLVLSGAQVYYEGLVFAQSIVRNACIAAISVLWYARFAASTSPDLNARIAYAFAIGIGLFHVLGIIPDTPRWVIISVFPLASALLCRVSPIEAGGQNSSSAAPNTKNNLMERRARFYASRIGWGTLSGVSIAFLLTPAGSSEEMPPWGGALLGVIVCAAFAAAILRQRLQCETTSQTATLMASVACALPVAASIMIGLPFLFLGSHRIAFVAFLCASASWMLQSCFRLNTWSTILRIDPALLAASEYLVIRTSLFGSQLLASYVLSLDAPLSNWLISNASIFEIVFAAGSVLLATAVIAQYMLRSLPGSAPVAPLLTQAAKAAADHYGLTPRETSVLELLAQGYSRAYIEQELCISKGTTKGHMYHIYQKLGVNSQDALIALVATYR